MSTTRESVRRTSFAGAWTLARIKAAEGCGVVVVEAEILGAAAISHPIPAIGTLDRR